MSTDGTQRHGTTPATAGDPDDASLAPGDFDDMRVGYGVNSRLEASDLDGGWLALFTRWLAEAAGRGVREPNAMVVATVDAAGRPSTRTVLCKAADERGLSFYTTATSRKGAQIAATGVASATFPWVDAERQVHVEGRCVPVDRAEAADYWATRPRGSQIAAWASEQSRPAAGADALDRALAEAEERFAGVDAVPMPERWGGFRIEPERVEFWQGGRDRFHDRVECLHTDEGWTVRRLQP